MTRILPVSILRSLRRSGSSSSHSFHPAPPSKTSRHVLVPTTSQLHRVALFESEQVRQRQFLRERVTKMFVKYRGLPEETNMMMNRGLSTPLDCAAHIQELLCRRSVLALVDGSPWDMNKPIEPKDESSEECDLELIHFKSPDPRLANEVFWRSCSFLLGAVVESAFKDKYTVHLCSFPRPDVQSGSFVYDLRLLGEDGVTPFSWEPTSEDLRILSMVGQRLALERWPFEPLNVDTKLADEMFVDSPLKAAQIHEMGRSWRGPGNARITVYRVGHHVDISRGPLMSHSGLVGRFSVTAVHPIESPSYGPLLRFQGVALPPDFLSHFTTFDILRRRAAKLNPAMLPSLAVKSLPDGDSQQE